MTAVVRSLYLLDKNLPLALDAASIVIRHGGNQSQLVAAMLAEHSTRLEHPRVDIAEEFGYATAVLAARVGSLMNHPEQVTHCRPEVQLPHAAVWLAYMHQLTGHPDQCTSEALERLQRLTDAYTTIPAPLTQELRSTLSALHSLTPKRS